MTELSSLEIRIQSNDVATAERRLQTLASSGSIAERATAALTNTFSRFSAPTGTAATALQNINQQLSRIRGSGASAASSTSSVSSSLASVNSSAHAAASGLTSVSGAASDLSSSSRSATAGINGMGGALNNVTTHAGGAATATGNVTNALSGTGTHANVAAGGFTQLAGSLRGYLVPAALATAAMAGLKKTLEVTREFDVLNASLITATGSAANAQVAFDALQKFAANTPYDLKQAVTGFTQLVNLGLTPSERAMVSYGNTASAMGKDLSQMIEAVADASTGEFERLKEFGIKSSVQGDKVSFTFKGITTTVGNSAKEIEGYLINLGETDFAGAMQNRMSTLDGAIANFGDTWDQLWLQVGKQGVGQVLEAGIRLATDGLQFLTDLLASGELAGYVTALGGIFSGFGDDIGATMKFITGLWETNPKEWMANGKQAADFIIRAFWQFPINMRSVVQESAVKLSALVDYGRAYGSGLVDVMVASFRSLLGQAKAYSQAVAAAFNPFETFDLDAALAQARAPMQTAFNQIKTNINGITSARQSSLDSIEQERLGAIRSFDQQIAKAKQLGATYKQNQQAKKGDVLAQFKSKGGSSTPPSAGAGAGVGGKSSEKKATDGVAASGLGSGVTKYDKLIQGAASKHGVDPALIKAIMHTESAFNPNARSPVGAQGLMQLMPATGRRFGVTNAFDPAQNIEGGTKYLAYLTKYFKGDMTKVVPAYNAGEGNVTKYGGVPPFKETRDYVKKVNSRYATYKGKSQKTSGDYGGISSGESQVDRESAQDTKDFQNYVESLRSEEQVLKDSYDKRKALIIRNTAEESQERATLLKKLDENYQKDTENLKKKQSADLDNLVASLRTEEEVVRQTYDERKAILLANTKEGDVIRTETLAKLDAQLKESLDKIKENKNKEINALEEGLKTEEQKILDSYNNRLKIVLDNTLAGSQKQQELKNRLDAEYATSVLDGVIVGEPVDKYVQELADTEAFFTTRQQMILENTQLTEQMRTDLEVALATDRANKIKDIETRRQLGMLDDAEVAYGGILSITKDFAGEQSGIYKVMFAASKAFAIADAVVKIQQGIAAASAVPWPLNLGAIASTIAATASVISTINSTRMQLSGAYDKGGMIPAGKVGLVGEIGPELVKGPAIVTGRERTAQLASNNQVNPTTIINIINNNSEVSVTATEKETAEGKIVDVVIEKAKREIARDIRAGGGQVSRSLEETYGVKRGIA